jgi:ABC-type transporter Mla MlaB component
MLRITEEKAQDNAMVLRLEGRLAGEWVTLLRDCCESWRQSNYHLTLELSEVTFADQQGATLLVELQEQQVELLHCSPFLLEQLKPVQTGKLAVLAETQRV